MKTNVIFLGLLVLLVGCGDGYNTVKVRGKVSSDFPGCEVQGLPTSQFIFLIRKPDGSVHYVEYMGFGLDATAQVQLFQATK